MIFQEKNIIILTGISVLIVIHSLFIASSNGVPIVFVAIPIHQEISSSPILSSITKENVRRVHRRTPERQPESMTKQQVQVETENDLETAAGTNVLRPLFVYRQQMAYRERNNRRLAARRRAIPDYY